MGWPVSFSVTRPLMTPASAARSMVRGLSRFVAGTASAGYASDGRASSVIAAALLLRWNMQASKRKNEQRIVGCTKALIAVAPEWEARGIRSSFARQRCDVLVQLSDHVPRQRDGSKDNLVSVTGLWCVAIRR